jgi:hypothetical protein
MNLSRRNLLQFATAVSALTATGTIPAVVRSAFADDAPAASPGKAAARPLPVGIADPGARFDALRALTSDLKDRKQAVGAAFIVDLTTYAAPTLLGVAARLVHHQPFVNLVITNIPGPEAPLYLMGARMLEAYPIVPLARNLAVGVALLSYCGYLHIGVFGDPDALPDLAAFAAALDDSFSEMAKIARDTHG